MEAAHISETSVDIQLSTRQYIPEDSELHTRRRENLKSHTVIISLTCNNRFIVLTVKCCVFFEVHTVLYIYISFTDFGFKVE
jgi:hypothetical protein